MKLLIYLICLALIYGTYALHQVENNKSYKIRKGIRAVLNVTETKNARSTEECAVQCASSEGCTRANFIQNSTCELMNYESAPGTEIELLPQNDSTYMYTTLCGQDLCMNTGGCQSTATGITCRCPQGFAGPTCSEECDLTYDGRCYAIVDERLNWWGARNMCNQKGGRLAEVCDPGLNDALLQMLATLAPDVIHWLGGNDILVEGQWRWSTGSCDWLFDDWGPWFDGLDDQDCLCITSQLRWNDANCRHTRRSICEFY